MVAIRAGGRLADATGQADAVMEAALRRAGVLRVAGLEDLLSAAETLARVRVSSRPLAGAGEWLLLPAPGSETLNTAKLRVVRGCVLAGSVLKKRFQPAHALFMAYGAQCTNREELTLTDPRTAAWLRGEEIDAATAQNGWCAVLVDGCPLGGGKVSGGRIKNHYPKGLRNLQ